MFVSLLGVGSSSACHAHPHSQKPRQLLASLLQPPGLQRPRDPDGQCHEARRLLLSPLLELPGGENCQCRAALPTDSAEKPSRLLVP